MLAKCEAVHSRMREDLAALASLLEAHAGFQRAAPENAGFVDDLEEALAHLREAQYHVGWISDAAEGR